MIHNDGVIGKARKLLLSPTAAVTRTHHIVTCNIACHLDLQSIFPIKNRWASLTQLLLIVLIISMFVC